MVVWRGEDAGKLAPGAGKLVLEVGKLVLDAGKLHRVSLGSRSSNVKSSSVSVEAGLCVTSLGLGAGLCVTSLEAGLEVSSVMPRRCVSSCICSRK